MMCAAPVAVRLEGATFSLLDGAPQPSSVRCDQLTGLTEWWVVSLTDDSSPC